jgi:hypothetical protein
LNPFTKDLGVHQGRIVRADAPEGSYVYELGHALLQGVNVDVGDYHEVAQTFVMDNQAHLVRATIRVVTPPILPIGSSWEVSAWLRGVKMVRRVLRPSKRVVELSDWRIRLRALGVDEDPNIEVKFRLELVEGGGVVPEDSFTDDDGDSLVDDDDDDYLTES